ncbi:DMT family transporter [Fictibacillus terranigra]|uniref:DMT family transporter n=1 Tax=Fictibacillus terranigra TaxID=3058424 RepID=A0ABT8E845_9BACL|nr:DMT family transporter [Fictibacillus sp. CENA-BCM004]MDN4074081.1 DMT family transporter [Fictibacillus sp. CENA-BCM004]
MKGILFALFGGIFITLQGVANSRISQDIGTWQAATITQMTGFILAVVLMVSFRDRTWQNFKRVKPMYLFGGTFAAVVIFSNVTAIHKVGVTLTISALLIAQLSVAFLTDTCGWFGVTKQRMRLPQFIGIGMMVAGVLILSM